ncbi:MAG: RedB protein [Elusimicrobiota bacterium]
MGALWFAACLAGIYAAMGYDYKPGGLGAARSGWPEGTTLEKRAGKPALLFFMHPRCGCTEASVRQLAKVTASRDAEVLVSCYVPADAADRGAWAEGPTLRALRQIPKARIRFDPDGAEARRFGAETSGTVLVYDPAGNEIFRGGITDRRGGEADNPGIRRLASVLTAGRRAAGASTPVYGCPVAEPRGGDGDDRQSSI